MERTWSASHGSLHMVSAPPSTSGPNRCNRKTPCLSITNVDGSSGYFRGGIVAYATDIKKAMGVDAEAIDQYGVYSAETAIAMATAVREPFGLITTGGGGAGADTTGLGAVTTGSLCNPSSFARRSFNSSTEIWSAMVFNTATWVMVKA